VTEPIRRVAFLTPNFDNNSLGRTYCLWLLARELGWETVVAGVKGTAVWSPLAGTAFAADCLVPEEAGVAAEPAARRAVAGADLVIAVKPLPTSFGLALRLAGDTPLLLDIDDPDIEVRTVWRTPAERLRRPAYLRRQRELARLGRLARTVPRLVSNPVLQDMYGGDVVPHVRPRGAEPELGASDRPVVRFVGSPRGHKGVDVLRRSIAALATEGFSLEVTGPAPADAAPWERWLGTTTLAEGERLVATADVVAIPSLPTAWSPAQLPAKLIDAMMHGRAIVASATGPVAWALGTAGLLVPPGDEQALRGALRRLKDPEERAEYGIAARERAVRRFSVETNAPVFERAAVAALREGRRKEAS
jgi:glycosyltransferase involved in cell wall biosynthesis